MFPAPNPNLTAGNQLPAGIYTWRIYANDFSENTANTSLTLRITPIDSVNPTVSFGSPGNGDFLDGTQGTGWNGSVSGAAVDPNDDATTPGSGVIRVTVSLSRNWTGMTEYYTASGGWTTASTVAYPDVQNPGTGGSQPWSVTLQGVADHGLPTGSYTLKATAQDRYGNTGTASETINVNPPDSQAPSVSVTTPASGANLSRLTAIAGAATDEAGGSGITRVYVQLSHVLSSGGTNTRKYWTNGAWSTTAGNLPVLTLSTPVVSYNWSVSSGLPTTSDLIGGSSQVKTWCFDAYGHQSTTLTRDFSIVANTAPSATAQTVTTGYETALPITLAANDAEGDAITYATATQPAHGTRHTLRHCAESDLHPEYRLQWR